MSAASIREQFRSHQARGHAAAAWRKQALAQFESLGFPTRKLESWRYTDVKPLRETAFDLLPPEPAPETVARARSLLDEAALGSSDEPRLVFVDGHVVLALSRVPAGSGLEVLPLNDEPVPMTSDGAWIAPAPDSSPADSGAASSRGVEATESPAFAEDRAFAALNTAFVRNVARVRIARNCEPGAPLNLVFVATGGVSAAPQPRVVVELGENATATLMQHFIDLEPDASGWINLVTDVRQHAGSRLKLYRLQEHAHSQHHTSLLRAVLRRDAELEAGYIDIGGGLVRNDIDVVLAEPGARVDLFGLALAGERQHVDNHVRIDHAAPRTASRESFRTIVGAHGHGVFNGKVVVRPGAQQIDAAQSSDNLLLSDKAEIDTKPELEIYADDVKCTHGATIGELDAEHLFYLRSRGMDESTARGLLMFAFANVSLERFPSPALRRRAALRVAGQLPEQIDWQTLEGSA